MGCLANVVGEVAENGTRDTIVLCRGLDCPALHLPHHLLHKVAIMHVRPGLCHNHLALVVHNGSGRTFQRIPLGAEIVGLVFPALAEGVGHPVRVSEVASTLPSRKVNGWLHIQ